MEKEMSGKGWIAIIISENIFKAKSLTDDKEGHYRMIKRDQHKNRIFYLLTFMNLIQEHLSI